MKPELVWSGIDGKSPGLVSPNTSGMDPNLAGLLAKNMKPMVTRSSTNRDEPEVVMPYDSDIGPKRVDPRADIVLSWHVKSHEDHT